MSCPAIYSSNIDYRLACKMSTRCAQRQQDCWPACSAQSQKSHQEVPSQCGIPDQRALTNLKLQTNSMAMDTCSQVHSEAVNSLAFCVRSLFGLLSCIEACFLKQDASMTSNTLCRSKAYPRLYGNNVYRPDDSSARCAN
jgi:hypothetical protein